jgi:hypothetical protein
MHLQIIAALAEARSSGRCDHQEVANVISAIITSCLSEIEGAADLQEAWLGIVEDRVTIAELKAIVAARQATAQVQRAATQAAHNIAADALRQAAAALLAAEPWLRQEVATLSATGGRSAADSGLATIATQLAPYALGALLVGVAVYVATEPRRAR